MVKKKIGVWVVAMVVIAVCVLSLSGKQGLISLYHNARLYKEQNVQLKRSHEIIDSLENEIKRLKNDTAYIEKIAREKLGMARKNEKVFKFIEDEPDKGQ